jgi:hypothetical protein
MTASSYFSQTVAKEITLTAITLSGRIRVQVDDQAPTLSLFKQGI